MDRLDKANEAMKDTFLEAQEESRQELIALNEFYEIYFLYVCGTTNATPTLSNI